MACNHTHHLADAVAVEVKLVLLEVLKVLLHLEEALERLRGSKRWGHGSSEGTA